MDESRGGRSIGSHPGVLVRYYSDPRQRTVARWVGRIAQRKNGQVWVCGIRRKEGLRVIWGLVAGAGCYLLTRGYLGE